MTDERRWMYHYEAMSVLYTRASKVRAPAVDGFHVFRVRRYLGTHAIVFVLVLVHFNNHDARGPLVEHKAQLCALRDILAARCPVDP